MVETSPLRRRSAPEPLRGSELRSALEELAKRVLEELPPATECRLKEHGTREEAGRRRGRQVNRANRQRTALAAAKGLPMPAKRGIWS